MHIANGAETLIIAGRSALRPAALLAFVCGLSRAALLDRGAVHHRFPSLEVPMIAVIFEVWPATGERQTYLNIAAELRPLLETIDGFLSIERFVSITNPEKMLSLSFWRDEAAVEAWRNLDAHRAAQLTGRDHVFADYRLRIASVVRDYGMTERNEAPTDSQSVHG
jgi:heme-degrading monooxygenase HmoA